MTLKLKLDLDMVKMYHCTKNEVSVSTDSNIIAQTDRHRHTDRQTHRHDDNITSIAYVGGNKMNVQGFFFQNSFRPGCLEVFQWRIQDFP